MASWAIETRTKHGLSLTVAEIVQLALKEGFTNIESLGYGEAESDNCRKTFLAVNNRCKEVKA